MPSEKKPTKTAEEAMVAALLEEAEAERPWKAAAGVSFLALMVVLGLPLWWKTTEVSRRPLPYSEIAALAERPLHLPLRLSAVVPDTATKAQAEKLLQELQQMFLAPELAFHPRLKPRLIVSRPVQLLSAAEKKAVEAGGGLTKVAEELDRLAPAAESGLRLVFLPAAYKHPEGRFSLFFGDRRNVYVTESETRTLVRVAYAALTEVMLSRTQAVELAEAKLKEEVVDEGRRRQALCSHGSLAPAHALGLYTVNPDPAACAPPRAWDLRAFAQGPLAALTDRLQPITNISLTSQTLYTVDWAKRPVWSDALQGYVLGESELPHLINPMEAFVTSREAEKPLLNLLVYLTPPDVSPLYVVDGAGRPVEGNAFVIAAWGGVVVVNGCPSAVPADLALSLGSVLRRLLGLGTGLSLGAGTGSLSGVGSLGGVVAEWETERLGLKAAVEGALGTSATLASLTSLLSQIHNIVIEEGVAEDVGRAVQRLTTAMDLLEQGGQLNQALPHIKTAVSTSSLAFFHESLLQLLYFPDDQKYAIYIPLFLPVGLPVLLSLASLKEHFLKPKGAKLKTH